MYFRTHVSMRTYSCYLYWFTEFEFSAHVFPIMLLTARAKGGEGPRFANIVYKRAFIREMHSWWGIFFFVFRSAGQTHNDKRQGGGAAAQPQPMFSLWAVPRKSTPLHGERVKKRWVRGCSKFFLFRPTDVPHQQRKINPCVGIPMQYA